ncbi:MAG: zinc-ribbon domain-containing protein [Clostridia bacterium]|nr:zinc-ribbon domain-containing protein [Clostridia bacterium]
MVVCPNCGAQLADGTKFCVNCGRKLIEENVAQTVNQVQQTAETAANTVNQNVQQQPYVNPTPAYNQPNYAAQQVPPVAYGPVQPEAPAQSNNNGFGIASLVCGILALLNAILFCLVIPAFIALIAGILAIIFAAVSKKKTSNGKMPGTAIAGLVLGILGLVGALIFVILFIIGLAAAGSAASYNYGSIDWEDLFEGLK